MSITLTPEQETWIKAHVASGDFASVEEAARESIDDRIAELAHDAGDDHDDMALAKPWSTRAWRRWNAAISSPSRNTGPQRRASCRPEILARVSSPTRTPIAGDYPAILPRRQASLSSTAMRRTSTRSIALATFPESGPLRPKLGRFIRIGLVSPYVVVYATCPTTILSPSSVSFTGDAGHPPYADATVHAP